MRFSQLVMDNDDKEVADLDSLIDHQKRLLFTETKIRAALNQEQGAPID